MMAHHGQDEWNRIIDLQLFAEGEEVEETTEDVAANEVEPDVTGDDSEEFDEITYNKETVRIPKSERKTYLQKGYNYDKVITKTKSLETTIERAARLSGFGTVDAYLQAIDEAERAAEQRRMEDAGITDKSVIEELIAKDPAIQEARRYAEEGRFNKEVGELANEFKDVFGRDLLQSDVSQEVLDHRNAKGVSLTEAFFYVNRASIKTMVGKEKSDAAKKALDEHKRQSSRGVESSDEAPVDEKGIDFTPEEKAWAESRVKKGVYKNKKEAWEWLRGKR